MTRAFMWFLLIASIFFLGIGLASLDTAKPAVLAFWTIIGVVAAFKLMRKAPVPSK